MPAKKKKSSRKSKRSYRGPSSTRKRRSCRNNKRSYRGSSRRRRSYRRRSRTFRASSHQTLKEALDAYEPKVLTRADNAADHIQGHWEKRAFQGFYILKIGEAVRHLPDDGEFMINMLKRPTSPDIVVESDFKLNLTNLIESFKEKERVDEVHDDYRWIQRIDNLAHILKRGKIADYLPLLNDAKSEMQEKRIMPALARLLGNPGLALKLEKEL